ncbi:MAG: phosphonate metabolism transcriptional regulator PhnF [Pseudomonadota bacterium]
MSQPVWQTIRNQLSAEIADGQFGPGAKLPTEAELARRFGVNRHTVRRALGSLADEGLVHARRGSGVFVTHRPVPYRLGPMVSFTQNMADTGHEGRREILRLETLPAKAEEAEALEIPACSLVHVLENVALIDGVPSTHSRCWLPAERLPNFPEAMRATGSITAALRADGADAYIRAWTRVSAGRADGATARHLQMSEGAPILRTVSLNRTQDGWPVEYAHTVFCGDRVEFVVGEEGEPILQHQTTVA